MEGNAVAAKAQVFLGIVGTQSPFSFPNAEKAAPYLEPPIIIL